MSHFHVSFGMSSFPGSLQRLEPVNASSKSSCFLPWQRGSSGSAFKKTDKIETGQGIVTLESSRPEPAEEEGVAAYFFPASGSARLRLPAQKRNRPGTARLGARCSFFGEETH